MQTVKMQIKRFESFLNKQVPFLRPLLSYLRLRRAAFAPASRAPFYLLDTMWKRKTIDQISDRAFSRAFIPIADPLMKGDVFEFGVCAGYSSMFLAKYMKKFRLDDTSLHLFDSFEGLPEDKELDANSYECSQGIWKKGDMKVCDGLEHYIHKKLSKILSPNRVHVVKGFFEDTLHNYFSTLPHAKAKLIHIDCDLYSSTKFVLDFLFKAEVVQDGTMIVFDDWMTSRGNPNLGQRKAVSEVLSKYPWWDFEKYFTSEKGSQIFVAHDLRITKVAAVQNS